MSYSYTYNPRTRTAVSNQRQRQRQSEDEALFLPPSQARPHRLDESTVVRTASQLQEELEQVSGILAFFFLELSWQPGSHSRVCNLTPFPRFYSTAHPLIILNHRPVGNNRRSNA